jgi:adenylate cyclase
MTESDLVRRLTTIMDIDVVGFSTMSARDEEHALGLLGNRMAAAQALVKHHRGRVFKLTGDGLLAEFASPVEAVRAALEIQEAMRAANDQAGPDDQLVLRIGVNLGDVALIDGDVYGDGVNVAARLQQLAEPGGILVSRTVHNHVRGKLELAFEPLGEQRVKNIPEPVAVFRACLDGPRLSAPEPSKRPLPHAKRAGLAVAALLLLAGAAIALWSTRDGPSEEHRDGRATVADPAATAVPVLAVLPFANRSGDPGQEYFSDGITEDLIAALGRFSSLRVVGRGTTFAYKGQAADPARIGRELGARYVVEGSVRRVGDRVRVSVELTDARGGLHLWSERYEQDVADVFAVQDAIVQRLVGVLAVRVTRVEQERASAKPPADLAAYDYVLHGRQQLARR